MKEKLIVLMFIVAGAFVGNYTTRYLLAQTPEELAGCNITDQTIDEWLDNCRCMIGRLDANSYDFRHWTLIYDSVAEAGVRLRVNKLRDRMADMDSEEFGVWLNAFAELARGFPDSTGIELALEVPSE